MSPYRNVVIHSNVRFSPPINAALGCQISQDQVARGHRGSVCNREGERNGFIGVRRERNVRLTASPDIGVINRVIYLRVPSQSHIAKVFREHTFAFIDENDTEK